MLVDYHGRPGIIRKGNRPGYFHIWPADENGQQVRGNALSINLTPRDIERWYPQHAETVGKIPDSSD